MLDRNIRILVACSDNGVSVLHNALKSEFFDVEFVFSLQEAESALLNQNDSTNIDLVIVGVHFNDSRALELLNFIRASEHLEHLPCMIVRLLPADIPRLTGSNMLAAERLGACEWLDDLYLLPPDKAADVLHEAIERALTRPVKSYRAN